LSEATSSSLIVEGRNVIVTEVAERAVAERPHHDTIESKATTTSEIGGLSTTPIAALTNKPYSSRIQQQAIKIARSVA